MKSLIGMVLALLMAGCAVTQVDKAREGVTTALSLYTGGIKALDAADLSTQSSLLSKVKAGTMTPAAANAEYATFNAKYDIAVKAFDALWGAIQATADVTAAADAKLKADIPTAVADLAKALADVVNALSALNIKIPGVSL